MLAAAAVAAALALAAPALASSPLPAGDASRAREARLAREIRAAVDVLAGDEMEGRGLGTQGLATAAGILEDELRHGGLLPAFPGGSYRQKVRIKTGVRLLSGNRLDGVAEGDFTPLGFSSPGKFDGEAVFAGYGIESPELGYRELEGLEVRGRVVVVLRYEPQERDEGSPFDGKRPSRWSAMRHKVLALRERGAQAVVFATGPLQDDGDKLPALRNDGPESPAGLPVLQVRTSVAARWLAPAGVDLERFQKDVDRDLVPRSRPLPGLRLRGEVALAAEYGEAENVAGLIPGRGALAAEAVVVGAHYDHLGRGGHGSMRPNESAVHNGADDNASGTAAVLAAGRELVLALEPLASRRAVVVALFAGEEVGLAGSSRYVDAPALPVACTRAMVNLDMVGRLRENRLVALGAESAAEWPAALERAARLAAVEVTPRGDGYGPSDQTSFYAVGVPVLHLFTGAHDAYHTPDDKPPTVDARGAARVAVLTSELVAEVARGELTPVYARASSAPAMSGDSRGYGSYLGTVPDYRAMESTEGGVLLADVRPGAPADRAGIRGGDRIVEMAATRIENLHDMTFALQDHRPGETIAVVVVRGGERLTLRATLGERPKPRDGEGPGHAAGPATSSTPAATAAATPPPPAPGAGHGTAGTEAPKPAIDPFYAGRPGPDFVAGAGKPFDPRFAGEPHLADVRQLTFGGENAEAYWSPDGRELIFQATPPGAGCDQQFVLELATGAVRRVSTGTGRTTCGYFDWPEGDRVVFASTHAASPDCPPPPDRSQGYVWALYPSFDLWEARPDGGGLRRLTTSEGYDAEATWCHRGGSVVFTSTRDGDPELYVMDEAGHERRLTHAEGYDGGAFFSPDCSEIVWRAGRPQGEELAEYRALMARDLVRPKALEVYVMKADGSGVRQVTHNGAANFCPVFHPDGKRIVYSSNTGSASGREFDLWLVPREGGEAERVTTAPGFDGFPQWSPDGRFLVWGSNRANPEGRETNLFLARWVD